MAVWLGLSAITLLSGCASLISDPPPPPETAPLEVVVGSSVTPENPCILNRDTVSAGTHDVYLIAETGPAVVRIRTDKGKVVFEGAVQPQTEEVDEEEPIDPEEVDPIRSVQLQQGSYVVECQPNGGPLSTAALSVDPARPGY